MHYYKVPRNERARLADLLRCGKIGGYSSCQGGWVVSSPKAVKQLSSYEQAPYQGRVNAPDAGAEE